MIPQQPRNEIKGPSEAEAGTIVQLQVQGGSKFVEVSLTGDASSTKIPVGPDGKVDVPIPPATTGRFLLITTVGSLPPGTLSIRIVSLD
ncbi:MAG: hypothetical protein Fur0037_05420 [Planctomycetota bacterium]